MHWNFFFTLAAVSILTPIVNLPPQYCGILGSIILIGMLSIDSLIFTCILCLWKECMISFKNFCFIQDTRVAW